MDQAEQMASDANEEAPEEIRKPVKLAKTSTDGFALRFLTKNKCIRQLVNGREYDMLDMSGGVIQFPRHPKGDMTFEKLLDLFYEACEKDYKANKPFYFCWVILNADTPRPLAFDFDYNDPLEKPLSEEELDGHHEVLRELVNEFFGRGGINNYGNTMAYSYAERITIYKEGKDGKKMPMQKVGIHAVGHRLTITRNDCMHFRHNLIMELSQKFPRVWPQNSWDEVIDPLIYDNGLRMNLANKCEECADCKLRKQQEDSCAVCMNFNKTPSKLDMERPYRLKKIIHSDGTLDLTKMEECKKSPRAELKLTSLLQPNCIQRVDFKIGEGRFKAPEDIIKLQPRQKNGLVKVRRPRNRGGAPSKASIDPLKDGSISKPVQASIRSLKSVSLPGYDASETKHNVTGQKVYLNDRCREWQIFALMRQFLCEEHKQLRITKLWTNADHQYYIACTDSKWCANKAKVNQTIPTHNGSTIYFFCGIKSKMMFQRCWCLKDPGTGVKCKDYFSPGIDIPLQFLAVLFPQIYPRQIDYKGEVKEEFRRKFRDELAQSVTQSCPLPLVFPETLTEKKLAAEKKDRQGEKATYQEHTPLFGEEFIKRSQSLPAASVSTAQTKPPQKSLSVVINSKPIQPAKLSTPSTPSTLSTASRPLTTSQPKAQPNRAQPTLLTSKLHTTKQIQKPQPKPQSQTQTQIPQKKEEKGESTFGLFGPAFFERARMQDTQEKTTSSSSLGKRPHAQTQLTQAEKKQMMQKLENPAKRQRV